MDRENSQLDQHLDEVAQRCNLLLKGINFKTMFYDDDYYEEVVRRIKNICVEFGFVYECHEMDKDDTAYTFSVKFHIENDDTEDGKFVFAIWRYLSEVDRIANPENEVGIIEWASNWEV